MINPGDNVVFLDLMYAAWDAEERGALDVLAGLMPDDCLSERQLGIIGQYGHGDPGDEDDREQRAMARLHRDIAEFERKFGHTIVNRPDWWPVQEGGA